MSELNKKSSNGLLQYEWIIHRLLNEVRCTMSYMDNIIRGIWFVKGFLKKFMY